MKLASLFPMSINTLLIVLLILAVFSPAFGVGTWGYGSPTWGVGPVLGVVLLVILLTRIL